MAWRPRNQIRPIRNRMQRRPRHLAEAKLQNLWARQLSVLRKLRPQLVCRRSAQWLAVSTSGDEVWFGAQWPDFSGPGLSRFFGSFFLAHFLNLPPFSK